MLQLASITKLNLVWGRRFTPPPRSFLLRQEEQKYIPGMYVPGTYRINAPYVVDLAAVSVGKQRARVGTRVQEEQRFTRHPGGCMA